MSTTTSTITKVGVVCIPVSDQDRALAFYVDVVGLEKRADVPFGNGYRWVEVAPPGGDARIAIVPPPEGKPTGNMPNAYPNARVSGRAARRRRR